MISILEVEAASEVEFERALGTDEIMSVPAMPSKVVKKEVKFKFPRAEVTFWRSQCKFINLYLFRYQLPAHLLVLVLM